MTINPVPFGSALPPTELAYTTLDLTWILGLLLVVVGVTLGSLLVCLFREDWRERRMWTRARPLAGSSISRHLPAVSRQLPAAAAGRHR